MSLLLRSTVLVLAAYLMLALGQAPPPAGSHPARYADAPPPAHTGGFGEPTCRQCHFGGELNAPGGTLALDGVPKTYAPGERYEITVRLRRDEMQRGGFELAARFAEGPAAGAQAGTLHPADTQRVAITTEDRVQYAHQTLAGTKLDTADAARWALIWTAPDTTAPVVFHAAANAANDDASAFGDLVYTTATRGGAPSSD